MKRSLLSLLFFLLIVSGIAQTTSPAFDQYFEAKTLRIDYLLAGSNTQEAAYIHEIRQEPYYGGAVNNLIDETNSGRFCYKVFDSATNQLIFSRGFCSLFEEWKGTPEALTISRAFQMAASLPYPKETILFSIESRSYETGLFVPIFKHYINPTSIFISRKEVDFYPSYRLSGNGDPSRSVDIAFIPEGYTKQEMDKFERDARRISAYMLAQPPFDEYANRFNIFVVLAPSQASGVGMAGENIYPNTSVNSGFYTFGMDRYLTTSETWAVYDIAANVPYDHVFILANSSRYGGGGFYNHYSMSTADHSLAEIVSIHEFGHGFGGLADEYYTSEVTYSDMYNLKTEPWEPNITTNVNFAAKWKSMIADTIPLPTPREARYSKVVGLFEGGGYSAKGIFSPVMDCRMKSNDAKGFCPVCREAIRKKIQSLCE